MKVTLEVGTISIPMSLKKIRSSVFERNINPADLKNPIEWLSILPFILTE